MTPTRLNKGDLVRVAYVDANIGEYVDYTPCLVIDTRDVKMIVPARHHVNLDDQTVIIIPMIKLLRRGKVLQWQSAEAYVPYFDET